VRGSSRRPEQVAENIRQVLAAVIGRELRDPRVGSVTITRVEVSGDLGHATVYVATSGTDDEQARALDGLESASGFLRSKLARVLTMRSVPTLAFTLDRGVEHARKIDALLDQLHRESLD